MTIAAEQAQAEREELTYFIVKLLILTVVVALLFIFTTAPVI